MYSDSEWRPGCFFDTIDCTGNCCDEGRIMYDRYLEEKYETMEEMDRKPSIYDNHMIREKNGHKIRRLHLLMIDHPSEPLLCDCCDEMKPLAHINDIAGNVSCICKDCLQEIIDQFGNTEEDEKPVCEK